MGIDGMRGERVGGIDSVAATIGGRLVYGGGGRCSVSMESMNKLLTGSIGFWRLIVRSSPQSGHRSEPSGFMRRQMGHSSMTCGRTTSVMKDVSMKYNPLDELIPADGKDQSVLGSECADDFKKFPNEFTPGLNQRVNIKRAIVASPRREFLPRLRMLLCYHSRLGYVFGT